MFKFVKYTILSILIVLLGQSFSFADEIKDVKNINKEAKLIIKPSKITTKDNITSYDIWYIFRKELVGENNFYIDGPSVCLKTTPTADGNFFPNGKDFKITLRKKTWRGGYSNIGTKTINFNEGTKILKWTNAGSGEYNLYFLNSDGRDWIEDNTGYSAIYNCN